MSLLRQKFRQSKDYKMEMLIRDLIEIADEIDSRLAVLEAFKASADEVGAWTPELLFGSASTGITYQTQRGSYLKMGRLVFIDFEIYLTSKGTATGVADLSGLPVTNAGSRPCNLAVGYEANMALPTVAPAILGYGDQSGNAMRLRYHNTVTTSNLTEAHFTNTSRIIAGGTYLAAA